MPGRAAVPDGHQHGVWQQALGRPVGGDRRAAGGGRPLARRPPSTAWARRTCASASRASRATWSPCAACRRRAAATRRSASTRSSSSCGVRRSTVGAATRPSARRRPSSTTGAGSGTTARSTRTCSATWRPTRRRSPPRACCPSRPSSSTQPRGCATWSRARPSGPRAPTRRCRASRSSTWMARDGPVGLRGGGGVGRQVQGHAAHDRHPQPPPDGLLCRQRRVRDDADRRGGRRRRDAGVGRRRVGRRRRAHPRAPAAVDVQDQRLRAGADRGGADDAEEGSVPKERPQYCLGVQGQFVKHDDPTAWDRLLAQEERASRCPWGPSHGDGRRRLRAARRGGGAAGHAVDEDARLPPTDSLHRGGVAAEGRPPRRLLEAVRARPTSSSASATPRARPRSGSPTRRRSSRPCAAAWSTTRTACAPTA